MHPISRPRRVIAIALLSGAALACGKAAVSAGPPEVPPVSVAVSPPYQVVAQDDTFPFEAVVSGATVATVRWSVQEGTAGGSVSPAGLYRAPTTPGTFHVVATADADAMAAGSAEVTVPAIVVSVTPAASTVTMDGTVTFASTVTGARDTSVAWSVAEGAGGGVVTAQGIYTAPGQPGTFHVVATSNQDGVTSGQGVVSVVATPRVAVEVSPAVATVFVRESRSFSASVTNTADPTVSWSVLEGSGGGAVSPMGLYTAPVTPGTFHVVATSSQDGTATGSAAVTVPSVGVAVTPQAASVPAGGTATFSAMVTNSTDPAVSWSVVEASAGGVVSAGGLYTAPAIPGSYHVRATAHVDGLTQGDATVTVVAPPADLATQLRAIAGKAIFFGHQSVGSNILAGLESLMGTVSGGPEPSIVSTRSAAAMGPGVLAESGIGENAYPLGKIDDFVFVLNGGVAAKVDVALMKFCFIDFFDGAPYWPGGGTPATLFARYQAEMAALRATHPGLRIVHVTAPLYQSPTGNETNVRREAFSSLMRAAYAGKEPVFDLALVESTHPDGTRARDPAGTPTLADEYTDDGGHLNALGKERAARALVELLAGLP